MVGRIRSARVGTLLVLAMLHTQHAAAADTFTFDVPAQPLALSLRAIGSETKTNVFVDTSLVSSYQAQALKGTMTMEQAIARLLDETDLQYEFVNDRTVTIMPESKKAATPPPIREAAPVQVDKPRAGTTNVPALRLAQASQTDVSPTAQDDESRPKPVVALEEVLVTGSRLKRTEDEGPAPVVTFDRDRIDKLGATSIPDVFNYLPQQPFSTGDEETAGGTRAVRLRGLGLGTTLVLINGRRIAPSAQTVSSNVFDLNSIPLSAVERIDVLAESAAAVYGTDAVGGVVNIILKSAVDQPTVDLLYGAAAGGGEERRGTFAYGVERERWRASLMLDYFDRQLLSGAERELFRDRDYRRFGGVDRRVSTTNPANIRSNTSASLPGLPSSFAAVPAGSSGVGLSPTNFLATAGLQNLDSLTRFAEVVPQTVRRSVTSMGSAQLVGDLIGFYEAMYTNRETQSSASPASLSNRLVPATNAFNPFGVPVRVDYLFTGIGTRSQLSDAESRRFVVGVRGNALQRWDWELSALRFKDKSATDNALQSVDLARVDAALASSDAAMALNVFQDGSGGSVELLQSLIADPSVSRIFQASESTQVGGFVRGSLVELPAGPLQLVVGAEWRRDEITVRPGAAAIPTLADRDNSSAYIEMQVPVLRRVVATVAGRYDDYGNFGDTFNPQFGLTWRPAASLLVRASHGTSFRAPSLWNLYQPSITQTLTTQDPRRNNASSTITISSGGNPMLDPEESESTTVGLVYAPALESGARLGLSYWSIEQDLRLQSLNSTVILANEALFPERVERAEPTAADSAAGRPGQLLRVNTTVINFGRLETSGIDLEGSHKWNVGGDSLLAGFTATWVEKFRAADFPNSPVVDRRGIANTDGTIPPWRGTATLSWERGGMNLSATGRYVSAYDDTTSNVRNGLRVTSQVLMDIQWSVAFGAMRNRGRSAVSGVTVRAGVRNVFDQAPHFSDVGQQGYDRSLADPRQRFGYVNLTATF